MMRYQRVSPDCLPHTNGTKKSYLRPSSPPKEDNTSISSSGGGFNNGSCTTTSLDGVPKGFRFRSTQQQDDPNPNHNPNPNPNRRRGDVLLQWGQRKRSRASRAEIRSITGDDSSSSSGLGKVVKSNNNLQRRSVNPSMPPPPPSFTGRSTNHRNGVVLGKESFFPSSSRNLEDRSSNGTASRNNNINSRTMSRSGGLKRSPPSPDQIIEKRSSGRDQKQIVLDHHHHHQRVNRSESTTAHQGHQELETNGDKEKTTQEWPRIYIGLSRKEKEEDFLILKGTKLPHRPRKRAKNIDKALQFCFPGMWLSDLTKNRYEVREKKNVKKQQKRRGLKGMENLDTDSE